MSKCFTWFPIGLCIRRTQYIPQFEGVIQESGILLGGLSDCEELVGVTHMRKEVA